MSEKPDPREFLNDMLAKQRLKEQAEAVCKEYGLNMSMFIQLHTFWSEGYTGKEAAETLGIHMQTVRYYDKTIRKMPESKVQVLVDCSEAVGRCVQHRK